MPNCVVVPAAEFIRNIGHWQNEALRHPVAITHHGRERLMLATPDMFASRDGAANDTAVALSGLRADSEAVLEHLEEGFLAFDSQLGLRALNGVACDFVSRAREECVGTSVLDLMPQPLASILSDRLQRVRRTRKSEAFEASSFDGRHVAVRVFPTTDGVAILFRNTTEQHVQARRFEEGLALEAALRRHGGPAAIKLDVRARIESIDDSFCERSGFSRDDLVGHRFVDLVAAPRRREVAELIERVLRDGAPRDLSLMLLGKRGEEMWGVLAVAPILADFVAHGVMAVWA